ncbi:MAG: EAL domain-containing protein [Vicinamibacterales bacterium]
MQWCVNRAGLAAIVALLTAAGLYLQGFSPWAAQGAVPLGAFAAVAVAAGLFTVLEPQRSVADSGSLMRLPFVAALTTLLFFGPVAMTFVAVLATLAQVATDPPATHRLRRSVLDIVTAAASAQAAALAYTLLGGSSVPLNWPWQGVPLTGAVLAYCIATTAVADVLLPLTAGAGPERRWPTEALRGVPGHVIGAAMAVALVELASRGAWLFMPLAALPLYFAWDAYRKRMEHDGAHERRLAVVESSDHGVCRVDDRGVVRQWNDTLAVLLECSVPRAVGRTLAEVTPALAGSSIPAAVAETLRLRTPRTLAKIPLRTATQQRVLTVTLVPENAGVVLVWADHTESARAEQRLRETAERFALIGEGANDGLWELDEARSALFVSARWRQLLAMPDSESEVAPDTWFGRIHPDDLAGVKRTLGSLADGRIERLDFEHRIRHEDGSYRRARCRAVAARDERGRVTRIAGSMTDITDLGSGHDQVLNANSRDQLTGLLNRGAFVERVAQRLEEYQARRGSRFAVLFLDLDRFKVVNDSLGHLTGDELLVALAKRLEGCLRPGDAVARLGADEFTVLVQNISDEMQANVVAFRLQDALQAPFQVGGRDVITSASIGIAISRAEYQSAEEIMRDADTAMCLAKARGKARHELFDADMHKVALDRLGLETDLRQAVKSSSFEVHYQPIVSLSTRMCTGFESLVRWNRNGKPVSPVDFIPMAEELGIIEPLGTWVMQQACATFVDWKARFPQSGLDYITVNVSAKQLVQQGFIYLVEHTVEQNHMRPEDLRLEITETAIMDAPQFAAQVLAELREYGVKVYLDDFGTGYSSLSHLHKLPVDALKIDRSFVRGLLMDDRPAIVESILALAKTLQTTVVAEGIEEEAQANELERLGCRFAQGYFFSRPLSAEKAELMLAAGLPLGTPRFPTPQPVRASRLSPVLTRDIA